MIHRYVTCLIIFLTTGYDQLNAQCTTDKVMLDSLTAIQNSTVVDVSGKIKRLTSLQQLFLRCKPVKDSVYARIVHRLGDMYWKSNDLEKAIYFTKEAITVNSGRNKYAEISFLANSYLNLGTFYNSLYLPAESVNCFDSCILVSSQYPEKYFITFKAFEIKAFSFFQKGDYQKSRETAENGILFAEKVNDSLNVAPLLAQQAQAEIALKQISRAERNITKSISLLESSKTDSVRLAVSYSIYASLLNKKGLPDSAVTFYQKAFELNRAKANWRQCANNMTDLGYLYDEGLQNDIKALACYTQGVKILEKSADLYQLAGIYINMGVANWRKKNFPRALQFYQKALNVLPIQFRDTAVKSNPSLNMLKLVANDYFISTLLSNKGEALLDQYKQENNKELLFAALSSFEAADKSVDLMRWKQYGDQSKLFWRSKTKSMYGKAIEVCYLLKDVEKAFYFFEKSRALLLNDKLSELGAKKFLSPSDNIKEQQLRIRISSLNSQLASLAEGSQDFKSAKRQMLAAQEQWEKFIRGLEMKYPVYYQYKYENAAYPFRSIKNKLLASNQTLVEFFNSDSIIYVLSISGNRQGLWRVSYPDYGSKAKAFITACSGRMMLKQEYSAYKNLAYELYEKLFKPLDLPPGRIIISPDDYFIPFEALVSDKVLSSSFLLRKYAFSYTYSMALLMKKTDESAANGKSFLGVAPVNYSQYLHLEPLMGADRSLKDIEPYFKHTSVLTNGQATKHEFLQRWSQYTMVQIYSHADADSTDVEPVLFLSDSALHINEIEPPDDYQTEMIILSACKTGIGKNAKGEGIFSLARAFMSVGIPSTVTTLWQVDNRATFNLTEAFYKYLSKGLPKDIAMQKAKLELIDNNDEAYRLPYYWAGNILLGKTASINEDGPGKFGLIITGVVYGILIILLAVALFQKRNKG